MQHFLRSPWVKTLLLVCIGLCVPRQGNAQALQTNLGEVGAAYARPYLQPVVNVLGSNLNASLFHPSSPGTNLFAPRAVAGIRAFATVIPIPRLRFDATFQDTLNLGLLYEGVEYTAPVPATFIVEDAPTLFGGEPGLVRVVVQEDIAITQADGSVETIAVDTTLTLNSIAGLLKTDIGLGGIPQLGIGTFYGFDLMVRWVPRVSHVDYGSVTMRGGGIRFNLRPFLKMLPFDVAVYAARQRLEAEDDAGAGFVTARLAAEGLSISRTTGVWRAYGTIQRERTAVDLSYTYDPADLLAGTLDEVPVDIEPVTVGMHMDGFNRTRYAAGFSLTVRPLSIHGEYSYVGWHVLTAGMSLLVGSR